METYFNCWLKNIEQLDERYCMGQTFQATARFQYSDISESNKNGFEMRFDNLSVIYHFSGCKL